MNHRHLLPNEIDLLLDEEVGFGVAPLRAHLRDCPACQERLQEARAVFDALEELPHLAPTFNFADKVMSDVPVFVPWHIAARDSVRRWMPRSQLARLAAVTIASFVASTLTLAILWVVTRPDVLLITAGVLSDRIPTVLSTALRSGVTSIVGEQAFAAIQQAGVVGLIIGLFAFLMVAAGTLVGLKAIANASSGRRG